MPKLTLAEAKAIGTADRHIFRRVDPTYKGAGIYVLHFKGAGTKIGIATNLSSRLYAYKSPWMREITNIQCYACYNPITFEGLVKTKFRSLAAKGSVELFKVDFQVVIDFLENNEFFNKIPKLVQNDLKHVTSNRLSSLYLEPIKFYPKHPSIYPFKKKSKKPLVVIDHNKHLWEN